jgi:choline dehydrogenase-like flavoprotein
VLIDPANCASQMECDVAVIGAGPAGLALALDLAGAGVDVTVLSSGLCGMDATLADLSRAASHPEDHLDPRALEARRFGGLSWSWGGRCVAFDQSDFAARTDPALPEWPVTRDDLMAHSAKAAQFLGLGAPDFNEAPDHEGLCWRQEYWSAQPQIMHNHKAALTSRSGPRVLLGATCTDAAICDAGRITSVTAHLPDMRGINLRAKHVVIAAGGLESARLLLWIFARNNRPAPQWTGRGYMGHLKGQIADIQTFPQQAALWGYRRSGACYARRRFALSLADLEQTRSANINFHLDNPPMADPAHGRAGLSATALVLGLPLVGARILPGPMRQFFVGEAPTWGARARHLQNVARTPLAAAKFIWQGWRGRRTVPVLPGMLEPKAGRFALSFNAEQVPRFENAIRLSPVKDRFGMPRIDIEKTVGDTEIAAVIRAHERLAERTKAAGTGQVIFKDRSTLPDTIRRSSGDGYHQIGLARMGRDPDTSVTDTDAKVHGIQNLFVAGSAVFPRSSHANPTLTIVCQALRIADHLKTLLPVRKGAAHDT